MGRSVVQMGHRNVMIREGKNPLFKPIVTSHHHPYLHVSGKAQPEGHTKVHGAKLALLGRKVDLSTYGASGAVNGRREPRA